MITGTAGKLKKEKIIIKLLSISINYQSNLKYNFVKIRFFSILNFFKFKLEKFKPASSKEIQLIEYISLSRESYLE